MTESGEPDLIVEAIRAGDLDALDVEAILFDYNEWVTQSDSPVAGQIKRQRLDKGYRIALRPDKPDGDPFNDLLDDIVVNDVNMFRAEQMSRNVWWMACYLGDDGDRICFDVRASAGRVEVVVTETPDADVIYEERDNRE